MTLRSEQQPPYGPPSREEIAFYQALYNNGLGPTALQYELLELGFIEGMDASNTNAYTANFRRISSKLPQRF